MLALSRNSVVRAYDQLYAEGFIESRVGDGTYVSQLGNYPHKYPQGYPWVYQQGYPHFRHLILRIYPVSPRERAFAAPEKSPLPPPEAVAEVLFASAFRPSTCF
jgi:DNA-binding transcriptional MocR family regulator